MGTAKGCCCGVLAGIAFVLILSGAVGFGIYLWRNPEARAKVVGQVDEGWQETKEKGDKVVEEIKQTSDSAPGGALSGQ